MALLAVSVFDRVVDYVSSSPVTYVVVLVVSAVDAFFPVVPSETVVITAGTLAATGDLLFWLVIPAAAVGAFAGDNISYGLGAAFGERAARRLFKDEQGKERLRKAQRVLDRYGGLVLIVARFVPGGRTATTFAAGTLEMSWRRFAVYDAIAAGVWATYSTMIGYLGGATFQENLWLALLLGFGIAAVITGVVELVRRLRGGDLAS